MATWAKRPLHAFLKTECCVTLILRGHAQVMPDRKPTTGQSKTITKLQLSKPSFIGVTYMGEGLLIGAEISQRYLDISKA